MSLQTPMPPNTQSAHDEHSDNPSRREAESSVRSMYEREPYPDLGADLKDLSLYLNPIKAELEPRDYVRFLDAGCGTGHCLVGVAKAHPQWDCYGIDLSRPSLEVAARLAAHHESRVTLACGSYLDPLPFEGTFDVISAIGTIHHTADPTAALVALRRALRDDGYMLLHVYGWRVDRRKFEIKEAISIFEPDLNNIEGRFSIYEALMSHERRHWLKRLLQMALIDIYAASRNRLRNFMRKRRNISWSPPFDAQYKKPTAVRDRLHQRARHLDADQRQKRNPSDQESLR